MKPEICVFLIVGMSPLLQNNPSAFIGKSGDGETLTSKKEYDDDEEAKLRVYLDPTGKHCHPCEAFIKAIIRAVTGKKFGNLAATSMIKGSVFIAEPFVIIEDENGNPKTDYSIDKRPVVIGKARVARCRPCWANWRMRVALEIDTSILKPKQVEESLSLAGRIIGIGDYRPEKGGGFGRFSAKLVG